MSLPERHSGGGLEPRRTGRGLWDWDPMSEFESLWQQMGRVFDRPPSTASWPQGGWMPLAEEEEETDDAYLVRAELPGIPRENININLDDNTLEITGELTEEHQDRVLSRRSGRFFYRTSLPGGIDSEKVEAELTDGILRVRIPKSGPSKRRRISIGGTE
ncbi:Hsp20/alpha crystallin family protein [Streptomyces sp. NPDC054863]